MTRSGPEVWRYSSLSLVWFSGATVASVTETPRLASGLAVLTPLTSLSLSRWRCSIHLQVSHKPKSISHTEAASIPYVANTALSALVNAAGLCRDRCADKRQVKLVTIRPILMAFAVCLQLPSLFSPQVFSYFFFFPPSES